MKAESTGTVAIRETEIGVFPAQPFRTVDKFLKNRDFIIPRHSGTGDRTEIIKELFILVARIFRSKYKHGINIFPERIKVVLRKIYRTIPLAANRRIIFL